MPFSEQRRHLVDLRARKALGVARFRRVRPPRPVPPSAIEEAYARALAEVVDRFRAAFEELRREWPALLAAARSDSARADAGEGKRVRELVGKARDQMYQAASPAEIEALATRFAQQTSTHGRIQFNRQTRAVLGADPFLADRRLPPLVERFVDANVGLIKNISDKLAADVEAAALRALQGGTLGDDFAQELNQKLGFSEKRAAVIARDQIGKLNGQITAARHREMGVTRFRWRCVNDERVRGRPDGKYPDAEPSHWARNEKVYAYSDPPDGELPGEAILCRCYPEPILDDLLDELAALE